MAQPLNKHLNTIAYPRTGKRGVPQQFPRRLYKMLQFESGSQSRNIISWSESGEAFRIADVSIFSSVILPLYFRTSKFSSFQRNLNLYGFSKIRRGPDTDMYAHPAFLRGKPELLSQLSKNKHSTRISKAKKLEKETVSRHVKLNVTSVSPCPSHTDAQKSAFTAHDKCCRVSENDERDNKNKDSANKYKKTGLDKYYHKIISKPSTGVQGKNITSGTLKIPKENGRIALLAVIMARVVDEDCAA